MNVSILYHPNSEHERAVLTYETDFKRRTGRDIELMSLETIDGAHMAKLYDITQYPAVLATSDDGRLIKLWQGGPLPLMDELSFYASDESDSAPRL